MAPAMPMATMCAGQVLVQAGLALAWAVLVFFFVL
jgi:hypothetical protein